MIKRIIFDVDNTLLEWKDEYIFALKNTLNKLNVNYTEKQLQMVDDAIVEYDEHHEIYNEEALRKFVNETCDVDVPITFMKVLMEEQGMCFIRDEKLIETIDYLSKKYNLVVLSNWFAKTQILRLKRMGILKYFSLVSGGDERVLKPNLEAFDVVLDGYLPSECIMVGDSFENDIMPALELGIRAIWVTKEENENYETIDNIYELKNIL